MEYLEDVVYEINSRKYRFKRVYAEAGALRGFSPKVGKWAWLMPGFIQFDGGEIVLANRIL